MAIEKIAYHLGRRDEVPNQELAAELAAARDTTGIAEIASFLGDGNKSVASDCIKVLYEIGYIEPDLITQFADTFITLLDHSQNRMVWGGMIALSTIGDLVPEKIMPHLVKIKQLIDSGTVITNVSGVKTLINMAKAGQPYYLRLKDELLHYQRICRNVDFTKRAEDMLPVIQEQDKAVFKQILLDRKLDLRGSAQKRLQRVINKI